LLALGALLVAARRRRRTLGVLATSSLAFGIACSSGGSSGGGASGAGGFHSGGTGAKGGSGGTGATGIGGNGGAGVGGIGPGGGGSGGTAGSGAAALMAALGKSVWQGLQSREGKERAYELHFDGPSLLWAEVRNPFGPARKREMRTMTIDADGKTVHTTVITPPGWPIGPENGRTDDWTVEVVDGSPRKLVTTREGAVETFEEGPWPAPTSGLTAIVSVFKPGGTVAGAFCEKSTLSAPDRPVIWDFARGKSIEEPAGTDVVAGASLDTWTDPTGLNNFAVTDVPGFDALGGTELSDQFDFIVLYLGTITHPGGSFSMREYDDDVRDAVWAWAGPNVGSSNTNDVFLEVHGHAPADLTADAPSITFAAQALPIEVMVLRCSQSLQDIDVETNIGSGWESVGAAPTQPQIDDQLFPPAL
jgi:hypothetical protein